MSTNLVVQDGIRGFDSWGLALITNHFPNSYVVPAVLSLEF